MLSVSSWPSFEFMDFVLVHVEKKEQKTSHKENENGMQSVDDDDSKVHWFFPLRHSKIIMNKFTNAVYANRDVIYEI